MNEEPLKILVIDDDNDVADLLKALLQAEGFQVTSARNGLEALEDLKHDPLPSVILLDLTMPVMDGWEFRFEQQSDARFANIPTIVLSADSSVHRKAAAIAAEGYIRKPIEIDLLLASIRKIAA